MPRVPCALMEGTGDGVAAGRTAVILSLPGSERQAAALCRAMPATLGHAVVRQFPDGESTVRLQADVAGRDVILLCTLDHPDAKVLPLLWLAAAVRENGAARIGLGAPYLPYMRQDAVFRAGEIVSARHFAALLSGPLTGWQQSIHTSTVSALCRRYFPFRRLRSMPRRPLPSGSATKSMHH